MPSDAQVYKGTLDGYVPVAVKMLEIRGREAAAVSGALEQLQILHSIRHSNVVRMFGAIALPVCCKAQSSRLLSALQQDTRHVLNHITTPRCTATHKLNELHKHRIL